MFCYQCEQTVARQKARGRVAAAAQKLGFAARMKISRAFRIHCFSV